MILAAFIELIAKIKQKNNGTFKLVDAQDVECDEGKGLDEVLNKKLETNLGADNADKVLVTDADGNVTTQNKEDFEGGGTTDYNSLTNKPSINGVEIKGQLTSEDLGIIAKADNILKGEIKKSLNPSVDDSFKRELWNLKMYGKSTQLTTTGKNLWNGAAFVRGDLQEDGSIKDNPNTNYGVVSVYAPEDGVYGIRVETTSKNGIYITGIFNSVGFSTIYINISTLGGEKKITLKQGENLIKVKGRSSNSDVQFNGKEVIMLVQGTEIPTYEPYTGGKPSPSTEYKQDITAIDKFSGAIRRNYQIFDKSKIENKTVGGINVSVENDGIHLNGTTTTSTSFRYELSGNEEIKKLFRIGNLNIKNNLSPSNQTVVLTIYLYNDSVSLGQAQQGSPFLITEDILNKLNRVSFFFFITASQTINCVINPMVYQEGDGTFQPFDSEPQNILYTPTQAMYSTLDGSISDFVDVQNGKEVYNMSGAVVFDGSEDGIYISGVDYGDYLGCVIPVSNAKLNQTKLLSNMFEYINPFPSTNVNREGICIYTDGNVSFFLLKSRLEQPTVEYLKEWLQANNLVVVYELATPTEIPIPQEQLAMLRKLYSYEGVTNFLCNGEVSCNYEISQQINNERLWQAINANKLNIATV